MTDNELQSLRNTGNEAEAAADEIARLRADLKATERIAAKMQQVWEDTRTQRDELLSHLTRKEPLPAWAVEWIRVYGA